MNSTTSTSTTVLTSDDLSTLNSVADADSIDVEDESPQKNIVRAGSALADQIIVSATNFATLVLIARLCEQSEVGLFHLAWTVIGFLRTGQERLISAPYFVFVHQPETDKPSFLGGSLAHQWIFAAASGVVTLALGFWFRATGQLQGMSLILFILAGSIPFILLRDHVRAVCAAHFHYSTALVVDACASTIQISGILLLAWLGWLDIPRVAAILGLACLAPTIAWTILSRRRFAIKANEVQKLWTQNWNYSRWLVVARTLGIGGYFAVPWIVVSLMDETSAGGFATASSLVGLSLMFINGSNNFFQPRTIRAYHDHGVKKMVKTIIQSILAIGGMLSVAVVMFGLAGAELMERIYGDGYGEYGAVVFWLSVSMLTVSVSIVCGNGLAALAKPKGYFIGEFAYCIVTIASAWLLIPLWGLNGAAFALVCGGIAASIVTALTLVYLVRMESNSEGESPW